MTAAGRTPAWLVPSAAAVVLLAVLGVGARYLMTASLRNDLPRLPELERYPAAVQRQLAGADARARSHPRSGEAVGGLAMAYHANSFFEQARVVYRLAMRLDEDDPFWPYLLGVLETLAGHNERALTFLERAVELDPTNAHAWARLGQIHFRRSAPDEAERAFARALALQPTHPHAGVGMARVLGLRGAWQRAAEILEPCVQAHPGYGPGHRTLALVYGALGRTADQRHHEELGSDVDVQMDDPLVHRLFDLSSTASVLIMQAQAAQLRGDGERPNRLLRRAVEVAPDDVDARLAIARWLSAPGRTDPERLREAAGHLERAIALDPSYPVARHTYATVLYALGDEERAEAEWTSLITSEPDHAQALASLGQLRYFRGDLEQARQLYERALEVPPDTPFSLGDRALIADRLAITYIQLGQVPRALERFREAVVADHRSVEAFSHWARLLREQGRPAEALAILEDGVAANPSTGQLLFELGNALLQEERFADARERLLLAVRLDPRDFRAHSALGYARLKLGDVDGAVESLTNALDVNPAYPLAHFHLGNALLATGRRVEAIAHYRSALQYEPGFALARQALATAEGAEGAR